MHTSSAHLFQNHKVIYEKAERLVNDQRTTDDIKEKLLKEEDVTEQELNQIIKYLKKPKTR